MIALCLGLGRSGSTLQYNLVTAIAGRHRGACDLGFAGDEAGVRNALRRNRPDRTLVLKTHLYLPVFHDPAATGDAVFFCTYRDLRDVAISTMRAWGTSFDDLVRKGFFEREIERYRRFRELSPLLMQGYQRLTLDLPDAIRDIGRFLDVSLAPAEVDAIAARHHVDAQRARIRRYNRTLTGRLKNGLNRVFNTLNWTGRRGIHGLLVSADAESGLHHNHIAPVAADWRRQLDQTQIETLRPLIADWLIEVGLERDARWR